MAIRIVAKLSKPAKACCACGAATHSENFYDGDPVSLYCDDCYVSDEKLKEIQARMPFCQPKPKSKFKIRIVPAKTKKVKCTVVPFLPFPIN